VQNGARRNILKKKGKKTTEGKINWKKGTPKGQNRRSTRGNRETVNRGFGEDQERRKGRKQERANR